MGITLSERALALFAGVLFVVSAGEATAALTAPAGASAAALSESRIDVSWQDSSTSESGFEVRRSTSGPNGTFVLLATTAAQVRGVSDAGLNASSQYCYRVRAFQTKGRKTSYSDFSATACATTMAPPPPPTPSAPSNAQDVTVSYDRIDVAWRDNSANETGFQIHRAQADGAFTLVASTGAGATMLADTGLSPSTQYCHKIRAFATAGTTTSYSDFSNTSCATTSAPPPPPPPPGLHLVTATTGSDPDADGYHVDVWADWGWSHLYVNSATLPSNGSVLLSGLMSGDYLLNVSGIAVNCELDAPNPYRISLGGGAGAVANLGFTCSPAKKLAFASTAEGNPAIYVANANGTEVTRLTSPSDRAATPAWSPDGSKIAYTSEVDGTAQIYVMNADGSNTAPLTSAAGGSFGPAWSPDGKKVTFTNSRDGNGEIYVMNSDGSGLVNLTQHPAEEGDPAWSPDGTTIAFWSSRDGSPGIYVMNADGSSVRRLTNDPYVIDGQPAWSPDGGWLAVSRLWCAEWCIQSIFLMSAFDGSAGALTALNPDCETHTDPVWYPEGLKITFTNRDYCSGETSVNFLRVGGPQVLTQGDRITFGFNASWRR